MNLIKNRIITPYTPEIVTQLEASGFTRYSDQTHIYDYVTINDSYKIIGASNESKMRKVLPNDKFIHMVSLLQLNDDPLYQRMIVEMY